MCVSWPRQEGGVPLQDTEPGAAQPVEAPRVRLSLRCFPAACSCPGGPGSGALMTTCRYSSCPCSSPYLGDGGWLEEEPWNVWEQAPTTRSPLPPTPSHPACQLLRGASRLLHSARGVHGCLGAESLWLATCDCGMWLPRNV